MFQKTVYNTGDTDITTVWLAGNETADTTDNEVDLYAVFGSLVKAVYHDRVLESVHLEDNTSLLALVGKSYLTVDEAV